MVTTTDPRLALPVTERLNTVQYVISGSPKYAVLLSEVWRICREPQWRAAEEAKLAKRPVSRQLHNRVLVFLSTPMTQQ
jgi:hypothetical protein